MLPIRAAVVCSAGADRSERNSRRSKLMNAQGRARDRLSFFISWPGFGLTHVGPALRLVLAIKGSGVDCEMIFPGGLFHTAIDSRPPLGSCVCDEHFFRLPFSLAV